MDTGDEDGPAILGKLSRREKVSLLGGGDFWHTRAIPRLGIVGIMMADGPHGLRKQLDAGDHLGLSRSVPSTCFPPAVTLASSWDVGLAAAVGKAIGRECRAEGVSILLGPGVNIKRSPLCGRNFEYYSEDPLLAGLMAAAFIDGVQGEGVGTSLKHFAANNQEYHRLVVDAIVDERTLREIYLSAFEIAVTKSRPWTVMCSYNRINGVHASDNAWLLRGVLRDEWGHAGLVMTDWGAMNDRVKSLEAGLDLEMPGNRGRSDEIVLRAAREGRLREERIDEAAGRLLSTVARARAAPPAAGYDRDGHHELARRAAEQSMVLLRNERLALPLARDARVAVIGPFAAEPRYQGAGSSQIVPTRLDAAYGALCRIAGRELPYAPGFSLSAFEPDAALEDEALRLAAAADTIVVFAGLPAITESEGFDRDSLRLPRNQDALIGKLRGIAGARLVVVLSNGGPVEMPWVADVDAILEAYLGGQAGGPAIARLLYGEATPSGKLAETFPVKLEDNPSYRYFPGTPERVEYREGLYVGYRYYDSARQPVLFPFGHGLSYTSFAYDDPRPESGSFDADAGGTLAVSCRVTNTGAAAGAEIAQLYVHAPEGEAHRPEQELKGFMKLRLEPGQSARAVFTLDARSFARYDTASKGWRVEAGEYDLRIGSSSRDIRLRAPVTVRAANRPAPPAAAPRPTDPLEPYRTARVAGPHEVGDASFEALLGRPLPPPGPARPYTWNSTLGQVSGHWLGRFVLRAVRGTLDRDFDDSSDPAFAAMVRRSVADQPFRTLVLMGDGIFSFRTAGALLDIMNGRPLRALGRLLFGKGRY